MEKQITLNYSHFLCKGTAQLTLWGGDEGTIEMNPFRISDGYTQDELKECLNDGGFGCQSIDGAVVDFYAVYTDSYGETTATKFYETVVVGKVSEYLLEEA